MKADAFGEDYVKLIKQNDERATVVPTIISGNQKARVEDNEGFGDEGDTRIALLCDTVLIKMSHWQNSKPKPGMETLYRIYAVFNPLRYFFLILLMFGVFFRYPNWCIEKGTDIRDNCTQ